MPRVLLHLFSLLVLLLLLFPDFAAPTLLPAAPVRLIIDTDAGFDVDDVGAIGIANALADNNECIIIAIGHTNGFSKGIGGVSTLMHFHQRDDVPLGSYKGAWAQNPTAGHGTADKYLSDLVEHYPAPIQSSSQVPTAVAVYRQALVNSPDHSVHIASIGITTNMRDLIQSPPDQYSPLNGTELVAQKVKLIVWMDMMYNFGCAQAASDAWLGKNDTGCHGSAQAAVMQWPTNVKQIFSSVGGDVLHGSWLENCAMDGNPYRQAFEDWGVAGSGRSSWDPIAVLVAVRGAEGVHCKEIDYGGHMTVDVAGHETWHPPTPTTVYNQSRISFQQFTLRSDITFELNQLLCQPTGPWSNINQTNQTLHWVEAKGANCYGPRDSLPAHGATDLEHPTTASAGGIMSIHACQRKCVDLKGCTGVTTVLSGATGLSLCYRKSDVVLGSCDANTSFTTWIRKSFYGAKSYNCWPGHGATNVVPSARGTNTSAMTVNECHVLCENNAQQNCSGMVWKGADHSGVGACFLKKDIDLSKCDVDTEFDTYLMWSNTLI